MRYLTKIVEKLKERTDMESYLWDYSEENVLKGDWILASPFHVWGKRYKEIPMPVYGKDTDFGLKEDPAGPEIISSADRPDRAPRRLLAGHSYQLYEEVYKIITGGRVLVDIATLHDCDGEFLAAIRNALSWLSFLEEGEKPVVRFLYSNYPGSGTVKPEEMRRRLMAKIPEENTLEVYVGSLRPFLTSWNHAKIVSADGKRMMTGGHNLSSKAYLGEFPVFDISMLTEGQAAYAAQIYLDYLWKYCKGAVCISDMRSEKKTGKGCYAGEMAGRYLKNEKSAAGQSEKVPMLAAGRRAAVNYSWKEYYTEPHPEPADEIFLELFGMAERKICISQQTISGLSGTLPEVIQAWAEAILRGVEIQIVVSYGEASSQAASGYSGMSPKEVKAKIQNKLSKITGKKEAEELIKRRLHVANLHYNAEESGYPGGRREGIPNHAKLVMIDDSVFYIGSQNQYKCNLNEFGIFAESREKCGELKKAYWGPLWRYSCPDTFSFEDAGEEAVNEAEAVLFWLELKINKMLRQVFTEAMEELFCVPEQERDYECLNGIIIRAGYETEYRYVRAVMDQPVFREIFAEDKERVQAFRFVRLLLIKEGMMRGFLECLQDGLWRELNEEQLLEQLQEWVKEHGFSCRIGGVICTLQELVDSNLNLWAGNYQMTLANTTEVNRQGQEKCILTGAEEEEPEEVIFTVGEDGNCSLNQEKLCSVQFREGTLCWESGELIFGRCLRSIGPWSAGIMQCEGWIERNGANGITRRRAIGIRLENTWNGEIPETVSGIGAVGAGAAALCSLLAIAVTGKYCGKDRESRERRRQYQRMKTVYGQMKDRNFSEFSTELELTEFDSETSRLQDSVRQGEPLRQEHEKDRGESKAPALEREKEMQREAWKDWEQRHGRGETEKRPGTEQHFEDSGETIQSTDREKRLEEEVRRRVWETSGKEEREHKGAEEKEDRRRQEERRAEEQRRLEEDRRRKEDRYKKRK